MIDHWMSWPAAAVDDEDGGDGCGVVVDVSLKTGSFVGNFPGGCSSWVMVPTRRPSLPQTNCYHCGTTTVRHHHLSRSRPTHRRWPNRAASGSAASEPSALQSFPASKGSSFGFLLLTHCGHRTELYFTHLCKPTTLEAAPTSDVESGHMQICFVLFSSDGGRTTSFGHDCPGGSHCHTPSLSSINFLP